MSRTLLTRISRLERATPSAGEPSVLFSCIPLPATEDERDTVIVEAEQAGTIKRRRSGPAIILSRVRPMTAEEWESVYCQPEHIQ